MNGRRKKGLQSGREAENNAGGTGRHYSGIGTVREVRYKSCDVCLYKHVSSITLSNSNWVQYRRKVLVPEYRDVVGFIRFPLELVRKTQERNLTPSNYSRLVEALIPGIENDPEEWITPI